jgi:uncharacterized protein YndB with AHSA1/START domain
MTFRTQRVLPHPPEHVFEAFADSARLARWWGPAGFTNTFRICEFEPEGTWSYTMHGPDGRDFANESVFREIEPSRKIVIHHLSKPRYLLTVRLEPAEDHSTIVRWEQEFENPKVAAAIRHIVEPANEQNLDRLAEVLRAKGS